MAFYTYIVASQRNGTLYTGSTDSLIVRTEQHRAKVFRGFTAKYGCATLVWTKVMKPDIRHSYASAGSRNGTGSGSSN